jgi:hypothetical protein
VGSLAPSGEQDICYPKIFGNKSKSKEQEIYKILKLYKMHILLKVCDD